MQVSTLDDWLGLFEVPIPVPNDPAKGSLAGQWGLVWVPIPAPSLPVTLSITVTVCFKPHSRNVTLYEDLKKPSNYQTINAADQAEVFAMNMWHKFQGYKVVAFASLPQWLQDNDYLRKGHRPPLPRY